MMKVRLLFSLALIVAPVALSPAFAQDGGDYGRPEQTPENMVRLSLFRFAFCAQNRSSATTGKLLNTGIASDEEAKLVKGLRTTARDCYGSEWPGFTPTEVRNAIAEISYRTEWKRTSSPVVQATGAPPASFAVPGAKADGTPAQQVAWYIGGLANCIAFVDTKGAHRLLMGPFAVPEEIKRFDELKPAIATCSGKETVAGLTPRLLRGYLADALLARMGNAK